MTEKVVLIIQARMGSSRLPGKSMMPLAGRPLVARILERVQRCRRLDEIILAVPNTEQDKTLLSLGEECGVKTFSGSENDLLERYYMAASQFAADVVVRIPADNATPEPSEIDRIVDYHLSLPKRGFTSNLADINSSGYPDGIGAEVFDFVMLKQARDKNPGKNLREHVHLNFFDYTTQRAVDESWCSINTLPCPLGFRRPDIVLDINTFQQYKYISRMYDYLYNRNPNFSIEDIIYWHDNIWSKEFVKGFV